MLNFILTERKMNNEILDDCKQFADRHRGKNRLSGPHWSTIIRFAPLYDEAVRLQNQVRTLLKSKEIDNETNEIMEIEQLKQRIAELEEQQRWIPVEEKLPEETGYYVIAWQSNWGKGELYSDYEFFKLGEGWDRANIKYWQPLPNPPESEGE